MQIGCEFVCVFNTESVIRSNNDILLPGSSFFTTNLRVENISTRFKQLSQTLDTAQLAHISNVHSAGDLVGAASAA
jgi:hypothetical protein